MLLKNILKILPLLLLAATLAQPAFCQQKIRRDILLMVDSIEMAYAKACPEIPLTHIPREDYDTDVRNVKTLNKVYNFSDTFSIYEAALKQNGFFKEYEFGNRDSRDTAMFVIKGGNLLISIRLVAINDSIVDKYVIIGTEKNAYCYTKKKVFINFYVDIFYIRRIVEIMEVPFYLPVSEPYGGTTEEWDNLEGEAVLQ